MGWWGRVCQAKGRASLLLGHRQWCCVYTNHRIDRDGHWQQFGTQPILISAPQWADRPCNTPTRFYRVGKKPSVKADLAIYSYAVDVHRQCMSESLILGHNLDFIMVGFCKSSHKYIWFHISWVCLQNNFCNYMLHTRIMVS